MKKVYFKYYLKNFKLFDCADDFSVKYKNIFDDEDFIILKGYSFDIGNNTIYYTKFKEILTDRVFRLSLNRYHFNKLDIKFTSKDLGITEKQSVSQDLSSSFVDECAVSYFLKSLRIDNEKLNGYINNINKFVDESYKSYEGYLLNSKVSADDIRTIKNSIKSLKK